MDAFEAQLKSSLERFADQIPGRSYSRVLDTDYHPRSRDRRVDLAASALAALAAAVAVSLSVIGVKGGTQQAFAGWSPVPTAPARGQRTAAAIACEAKLQRLTAMGNTSLRDMKRYESPHAARRGLPASNTLPLPQQAAGQRVWRPVLTDTRGPYTLVLLTNENSDATCLTAPRSNGSVVALGMRSPSSAHATVKAGRIGARSGGLLTAGGDNAFVHSDGRVGAGVKAVTLYLADGRQVAATVADGWYLAWWPGRDHVAAIRISGRYGSIR